MVACDFCKLHWHLDCLNPPMTIPPHPTKKWMCPCHAEHAEKVIKIKINNNCSNNNKNNNINFSFYIKIRIYFNLFNHLNKIIDIPTDTKKTESRF